MHRNERMNLVVIGGVAAGASFAARARRLSESARITVIERGPDVSFANCGLPYHIGGEIPNRDALAVQTPESLKALLNIEVRTLAEAVAIDRSGKRVQVRDVRTGHADWLDYDALMLAPGAVQIFYGDETLRPFGPTGSDPLQGTRSDMNWQDLKGKAAPTLHHWQILGQFRARHPALGAGKQTTLPLSQGYGFSREHGDDKVMVVWAGNR